MTITITIDPAVESVGIQTIAKALRISQVTDEEARLALAENLRTRVAQLYVEGDRIIRETAAEASAVSAAATYITTT